MKPSKLSGVVALLLSFVLAISPAKALQLTTTGAGKLVSGGGGGGSHTFVQACTNDKNSSGAGNLTCTFSAGTTSGNGVAVYAFWASTSGSTAGTQSSTDVTGGGTYSAIVTKFHGLNFAQAGMYLAPTVTAGTTVVTFNCSTNATALKCNGFEGIVAFEITNVTGADSSNGVSATGSATTNADTCTSFTTTSSNDMILFGATDDDANTTTFSAGTSPLTFTVPTNGRSTNKLATMEYGTQTSAAAINPAFTGNSTNLFVGVCMGIK